MIRYALIPALVLLPSFTIAQAAVPDEAPAKITATDETDTLSKKIEDKLAKHKLNIARSTARLKRDLEKSQNRAEGDVSDELDAVADLLEDVFAKDGLFRDLSAMFTDFAEDIEVDTDDGKTVLRFDGATVGQIETRKNLHSDDHIAISGLGRNLTLDRQTIKKDGKSKTRIVIELDGKDGVEVILPEFD